jgi:hypothetical protein
VENTVAMAGMQRGGVKIHDLQLPIPEAAYV